MRLPPPALDAVRRSSRADPSQQPATAGVRDGRSGDLDEVVSHRVRAFRTSRGWRQLDLAVAAGWSHATVAAVEAGEKRLTLRDAAVLCRVLRVPLLSLLEGAEEVADLGLAPSLANAERTA